MAAVTDEPESGVLTNGVVLRKLEFPTWRPTANAALARSVQAD
jgi:hypothetical protein